MPNQTLPLNQEYLPLSGNCIRKTVVVGNAPDGLHMRPAMAFAKLARKFNCQVRVHNGPQCADGQSPTELLMLIALPGTELVLEIEGDEAPTAWESLAAILSSQADVATRTS